MSEVEIGIIGGSGLYELAGLQAPRSVELDTPFGKPSGPFHVGTLAGRPVAFLARHGPGHTFAPTDINYRANIFGFKLLGAGRLLSASAVGSLKEEIAPGQVVVPDQFIDRTRKRADTFFGDGLVAHVSMADPICSDLADCMAEAAVGVDVALHRGGTYVCMEGPQFSTRAESHLYRSWGASVIGMTNIQEARLAREAEICYVTLALVTDYDCWREGDAVDVEEILHHLRQNAEHAAAILKQTVHRLPGSRSCGCSRALEHAILTQPDRVPDETRKRLEPLVGHRLGRS